MLSAHSPPDTPDAHHLTVSTKPSCCRLCQSPLVQTCISGLLWFVGLFVVNDLKRKYMVFTFLCAIFSFTLFAYSLAMAGAGFFVTNCNGGLYE